MENSYLSVLWRFSEMENKIINCSKCGSSTSLFLLLFLIHPLLSILLMALLSVLFKLSAQFLIPLWCLSYMPLLMLRQLLSMLYTLVSNPSKYVHSLIYLTKFTTKAMSSPYLYWYILFLLFLHINCPFLSPQPPLYCPCKDLVLENILFLFCNTFLPLYQLNFISQYTCSIISYLKM